MKVKLHYYKELDGIRAIAAIMIILFHFFRRVERKAPEYVMVVRKISFFGQTGVTLFFVLSGFLITRILLTTKNQPGFFKNFYARRILRIFPLYYLFLALWYFVVPFCIDSQTPPFSEQIYFWTYLQNFARTFGWRQSGPFHFWSLAVEEHFYLFWPFLVYVLNPKMLYKAIWLIVIFTLVTRVVLLINGIKVQYFTFARIDELAIGGFLAIWEISGKLKKINSKKFIRAIIWLLVPTLLLWFVTSGDSLWWIQVIKYILLAFIYFIIIGFVITADANHWFSKLLRQKFFAFTGKISYGLYVFHPLCFLLTERYFKSAPKPILFILDTLSSYVMAYISYQLFESKFIALKKYFEYKILDEKTANKNPAIDA